MEKLWYFVLNEQQWDIMLLPQAIFHKPQGLNPLKDRVDAVILEHCIMYNMILVLPSLSAQNAGWAPLVHYYPQAAVWEP